MNAPDKPPMIERSTTVRFFRWLFTWRVLRRMLILLAWLAALIALFHGEENWRGRRAWNQYRRALEAQGAVLDFKAVIPKPVPDNQNFAATPVIKSWFEKKTPSDDDPKWHDSYEQVGMRVHPPRARDAKAQRRFQDLVAWETAFATLRSGESTGQQQVVDPAPEAPPDPRIPLPPTAFTSQQDFYSTNLDAASRAKAAPAVLEALKTNEALFAELRLASRRPQSRYPVNYDVENPFAINLPHFSMIKGACLRLQLKACAELASGQSEQALEDLRLMFYLADSLRTEPFLISHLVRLACVQLAMQPLWEGLAEHRWSEVQLQELETRLRQYDLVVDMKPGLYTDRAAAISTIELLRRKGPWYLDSVGDPNSPPPRELSILGRLIVAIVIPQGWFYQEKLNYCRGFQTELATGLDATMRQVSPTRVKADAQAAERVLAAGGFAGTDLGIVLRHQVMARMLLPALGKVFLKSAAAQTAVNQAAVACALERYRLTHGQFPDKLEALPPQFISPLPNDVLTGEPCKYRRTDDGQFVLYSIGWDEKDDGGVPGKRLFDDEQGDWVWEYPAK